MNDLATQFEKALQLHRTGQSARAAQLYREILRARPDHPDALNLLGIVHQQAGEHPAALDCFSKAIRSVPGHAGPLLNRALSLRALGRGLEALADFNRALAIEPTNAEAHHQLGNLLKLLNRHAEAAKALRRAAELAPNNAVILLNLGVTLLALSEREQAIASFQRAVDLDPGRAEAHNVLGSALLEAGRASEARTCFEAAIRLNPAYPAAHDNMGRMLRAQGRAAEAIGFFKAALAARPDPATHSNLLYALHFVPGFPPAGIAAEHKRWAELHAARLAPPLPGPATDVEPGRRLRIGYVSPDFQHHAVAHFIEPVLMAHDRSRVEVFGYSNLAVHDHVTLRLRSHCDQWRDIPGLDDGQVAEQIKRDKIDLLVDLAGHTAGNRLLVFARRPAPVQVTWLGYPDTTGLAVMDWRITDAISDPAGSTEGWHSEKLFRMPGPFSVYRPSDASPPVGGLPALAKGHVTFGSFNHFAKISPEVLATWARLLARVPASRLLMKARGLADPATASRVLAVFADQGIARERIELCSDALPVAAHQAMYHHVDIALDTFPYNGTTTTCEALWMGVPVVTLAGQTHVSRVTASLLSHLGYKEWIGESTEDYIGIAAALASDTACLARLRAGQRERMRASPLCDAGRFTAQLEEAYRYMWRSYCENVSR